MWDTYAHYWFLHNTTFLKKLATFLTLSEGQKPESHLISKVT